MERGTALPQFAMILVLRIFPYPHDIHLVSECHLPYAAQVGRHDQVPGEAMDLVGRAPSRCRGRIHVKLILGY